MKNRIIVAAVCAMAMCMTAPTLAATSAGPSFPERPVRAIVPTAPSGGTDFVTRVIAPRLGDRWGQTVVVDNRAGATGLIAFEIVARAAPDGHSLLFFNVGQLLAQLSSKLSFKRGGDFTPIARFASSELIFVMYPGVPAKSMKDFVELARAKPGQINYASSGTAGLTHLAMALFGSVAGVQLTHVPYNGIGPSFIDLIAGRVQISLPAIAPAIQHVQAGRLRALAVTRAERVPLLPDVPTMAQAGYPRYDVSVWWGVFGPARMPASLVARLNADLNSVVQQPDVAEKFAGAGVDPAGGLSPAQFADYTETEVVKWNDAFKAAGLR